MAVIRLGRKLNSHLAETLISFRLRLAEKRR